MSMKSQGSAGASTGVQIGSIRMRIVRDEFTPVFGGGTGTFGELIDLELASFLKNSSDGTELLEIGLQLDPDAVRELRQRIRDNS